MHARAMEILRGCRVEPALRAVELPITPGAEWRSRRHPGPSTAGSLLAALATATAR